MAMQRRVGSATVMAVVLGVVGAPGVAAADGGGDRDPDPKRKVCVLEYRAGSAALPGIGKRLTAAISKDTSIAVLGPDQTRVAYGDALDTTVVKCAGEAPCIAAIAKKVGAAEVILVGVSELGDVILTMQRIDAHSSNVAARIADSLAEGAAPTADQVDAYLQRLLPASDFRRFGVIDIVANLGGAVVTVAGEKRGLTPILPLTLPAPASYAVRIEKTGYVPYSTTIALPPDGRIKVEAELNLRGATAWYQHWYVLAGAAVLVAGAGSTAVYFATRDTTSGPGMGTLGLGGQVK